MRKIAIVLGILFYLTGCKSQLETSKESGQGRPDFSLDITTTPCYGKCPVYTLSIDNDLKVVYKGIMNTDLKGTFSNQLSQEQLNLILTNLDRSGFWNWKGNYDVEGVQDFPTKTLEVNYGKKSHKVRSRVGGPANFNPLLDDIQEIISQNPYKKQ
ncbi:MAG: DUF6438 domain-containing protein [Bacteroidia bacterium]|nr:DUF6438 domain-containing protein [Bacteroidia bacterium]